MRTVQNIHGVPVIVSTEEYKLIRKIHAKGKCPASDFSEFYQELAHKLFKRSVLNCDNSSDEPLYSTITQKPKE